MGIASTWLSSLAPAEEVVYVSSHTPDLKPKTGSDENILEVRDLVNTIEFYINGTMVNSIQNAHGYPNGVAGLYSGDGVKIAFKNLEIRK